MIDGHHQSVYSQSQPAPEAGPPTPDPTDPGLTGADSRPGAVDLDTFPSMIRLGELMKLKRINARFGLNIVQDLRSLVRSDATECWLTYKSESAPIISALYRRLANGFRVLATKVRPIYKPLYLSSADFWDREADKAPRIYRWTL